MASATFSVAKPSLQASGKGFTDFSGLRSSSAFLPFTKKTSDDFVSVVAFQTSAMGNSSGGYRKSAAEAKIKVAINGFGRIGRNFLRCWHGRKDSPLDVIAINDTGGVKQASHLLKYDSTLGIFDADVKPVGDNAISVDGKVIKVVSSRNPLDLPWKDLEVDLVIEGTGVFVDREGAGKHITAGAKKVLITAPGKGDIPTYVVGVNADLYSPDEPIISNASCTTNCLAPFVKVLDQKFVPTMDLMRSEPMQLVQLIIPIESAYRTISYLGDLGLFQFNDLNAEKSPFQRTYAAQIKRCEEMARKLRFFKEQMTKAGLSPTKSLRSSDIDLDRLEVVLGELESELIEINSNNEMLQHTYNELSEYKLVLQKAGELFHSAQSSVAAQQSELEAYNTAEASIDSALLLEQEMTMDPSKQVKLGYISGLVAREKAMAFERILFRATRGNVFLKQSVLENAVVDPVSGDKVEKNVFIVFYSGERAKNKILKLCEGFGANRYPFLEDLNKQFQIISQVSGRLAELKTTIDVGLAHWSNLLQTIGFEFEQWNFLVKKEKSIYHTLNMLNMDVTKKCLVAEGWCPVFATDQIQNGLRRATLDSSSQIGAIFHVLQTKDSPPTYFRTNKFTSAFQEIVDAYG